MARLLIISLLLLPVVGFLGCYADIPRDVITSLPGWNGPTPTKQYSGYINISDTKHMHYWYVSVTCSCILAYFANDLCFRMG